MERVRAAAAKAWAWAKVVLTSWPAVAAGVTAIVTGLSIQVVPEIPGPWGVRAAAWLAAVATVVRVVGLAVAVLTPVLFPQNRGVLAPPPAQSPSASLASRPSNVRVDYSGAGPLPPVPPDAYPPGSERLPHRRPG